MISGFEAYQIFQGVRLHFTSNYDYFKYSGKTRSTEENFETRKDKYLFYKIGRKYDAQTLPFFFAVNYAQRDDRLWINNFMREEAVEAYETWLKWQQARSYNFKEALNFLNERNFPSLIVSKDGQFPELMNLVFQKEIYYDVLVILDNYIHLVDAWDKKISDDFIWPSFSKKFKKYVPFFNSYAKLDDSFKKMIVSELTNR